MREVRCTLLGDGPSDSVLLSVLEWLFEQHIPEGVGLEQVYADLSQMREPPARGELAERIRMAIELYPCELLFVHRDAEAEPARRRYDEIEEGISQAGANIACIPIVPVRMSEAWLLHDEEALRAAVGRPSGTMHLMMPSRQQLERVDAKQRLFDLFRVASETTGRRRHRLNLGYARHRLADLIDDFGALRGLETFDQLERDVADFCQRLP